MAPQVGFEPTTRRLTADCSTTELLRNKCTLIMIRIHYDEGKLYHQILVYPRQSLNTIVAGISHY